MVKQKEDDLVVAVFNRPRKGPYDRTYVAVAICPLSKLERVAHTMQNKGYADGLPGQKDLEYLGSVWAVKDGSLVLACKNCISTLIYSSEKLAAAAAEFYRRGQPCELIPSEIKSLPGFMAGPHIDIEPASQEHIWIAF